MGPVGTCASIEPRGGELLRGVIRNRGGRHDIGSDEYSSGFGGWRKAPIEHRASCALTGGADFWGTVVRGKKNETGKSHGLPRGSRKEH